MDTFELLKEAREVLGDYWFTTTQEDGYAEEYNNNDVIEICKKIDKFLKSSKYCAPLVCAVCKEILNR